MTARTDAGRVPVVQLDPDAMLWLGEPDAPFSCAVVPGRPSRAEAVALWRRIGFDWPVRAALRMSACRRVHMTRSRRGVVVAAPAPDLERCPGCLDAIRRGRVVGLSSTAGEGVQLAMGAALDAMHGRFPAE